MLWMATSRRLESRTHRLTAADRDSEEFLQELRDLAMRQSQRLIQPLHRRLGDRPQLDSGSSESIWSLHYMPALQSLAALSAAADMHVQTPLNRLLRKLELILPSEVRLADIV